MGGLYTQGFPSHILKWNEVVNLKKVKIYENIESSSYAKDSIVPTPSNGSLSTDKPLETMIHPLNFFLHPSTHNPNSRVPQNYSIVKELR